MVEISISPLSAEADLQKSLDLLQQLKTGELTGTIARLRRPQSTLAFGQRDARLPGFPAAQAQARRHGYEPVVRRLGGQAAGYHPDSLVLDHLQATADAMVGYKQRFMDFGTMLVEIFGNLGISAGIGEIPGEYCAGEYSVYISLDGVDHSSQNETEPQKTKVVGTAQRVVSGAWLFSASIIVANPEPLRAVVTDVYEKLNLELDPSTVGALTDARPHITVEEVQQQILDYYATNWPHVKFLTESPETS